MSLISLICKVSNSTGGGWARLSVRGPGSLQRNSGIQLLDCHLCRKLRPELSSLYSPLLGHHTPKHRVPAVSSFSCVSLIKYFLCGLHTATLSPRGLALQELHLPEKPAGTPDSFIQHFSLAFPCMTLGRVWHNTMSGGFNAAPQSVMDEAVAMVARRLWSMQVLKILRSLFWASDVGGL